MVILLKFWDEVLFLLRKIKILFSMFKSKYDVIGYTLCRCCSYTSLMIIIS